MASAAIAAGGSILSGIAGGKGAAKAAKIQAQAYQKGIDEQNREFGIVQQNNQPYMQAGTTSLGQIMNYLGLGPQGAAGATSAIDALKTDPTYLAENKAGLDTILQGAAATGGLRGGNTALDESNFGAQLLASVLGGRLSTLGGLVGVGQSAASGTNGAAMTTGANVSNLLGQQGGAQAIQAASPYLAFQQALAGVGKAYGSSSGGSLYANSIGTIGSSGIDPSSISVLSGYTPGRAW